MVIVETSGGRVSVETDGTQLGQAVGATGVHDSVSGGSVSVETDGTHTDPGAVEMLVMVAPGTVEKIVVPGETDVGHSGQDPGTEVVLHTV